MVRLGLLGVGLTAAACGDDGTLDDSFDRPLSCDPTPGGFEGPFFSDTGLVRSDIVEDRRGAPMMLHLQLVDSDRGCEPIERAQIEVWHADADGAYSAYDRVDGNLIDADGLTFLRGAQETDAAGRVAFVTIFPGWYPGRTTHVHAKVLVDGVELLTTQIYFAQDVNDAVLASGIYAERGPQATRNAADRLLRSGIDPFFDVEEDDGILRASAVLSLPGVL